MILFFSKYSINSLPESWGEDDFALHFLTPFDSSWGEPLNKPNSTLQLEVKFRMSIENVDKRPIAISVCKTRPVSRYLSSKIPEAYLSLMLASSAGLDAEPISTAGDE